MRGFVAQLGSREIYEGCRTPSEHSELYPSSPESIWSPCSSAREIYEGMPSPDWWELPRRSIDTDSIVDGGYPSAITGRAVTTGSCTSCFSRPEPAKRGNTVEEDSKEVPEKLKVSASLEEKLDISKVQTFSFRELAAATNNFRADCLIGKGGSSRVYRGRLKKSDQVVAIKQLKNKLQQNQVFLVEVLMLSLLRHPNIVNLIGYCADGSQRLLVYEYMPLGSLEDHLHDLSSDKKHLDWKTRMTIASGIAKGLEYLHDKVNPSIILHGLKSSSILLGEGYHPKLSSFGLAKRGPVGNESLMSTRVTNTSAYSAPEYVMFGEMSLKSDLYAFGVVLLEIITGRKAKDYCRSSPKQSLVLWGRPLSKDWEHFPQMADPNFQGEYPVRGLYQAFAVAAACVQEQPTLRPPIADVVTSLNYLASQRWKLAVQPPVHYQMSRDL